MFEEKLLSHMYLWLDNESLIYFSLDTLLQISLAYPSRIDTGQILKFGARNAIYLYTVCQILTVTGTDNSSNQVNVLTLSTFSLLYL